MPPTPSDAGDRRPPRVRFKDYGSLRANLLLWGIPLGLVALFVLANIGPAVGTSVGSVQVTCEGWTRIDPGECSPWAREVLETELPAGRTLPEVAELDIKRSGFGLIDHCTAALRFHGGATVDREIPCR